MTYQQVDELGYANRGTLYRIVHRTLDDHEAQNVNLLRLLEVSRLNALQVPLWQGAMDGDVEAAAAVMRIMRARVRILGARQLRYTEQAHSSDALPTLWEPHQPRLFTACWAP